MPSRTSKYSTARDTQSSGVKSAGVFRRLAALVYDGLLMIAIAFVVTNVYLIAYNALVGLEPKAIDTSLLQWTLFPILLFTNCFFLVWFWLNGGRTLGMRAWHLRLVKPTGDPVHLSQAMIRLISAPLSLLALGLGYWSCWIDPQGCAWHDRFSQTRVVLDKQKG